MKKQIFPFIVISLLSLAACGDDGYIKCRRVDVGNYRYEASVTTITFVFAYKAEGINSKQYGVYGDKNDTVYVMYRCDQETADKGISIPRTGVINYGSSNLSEAPLTYSSDMGKYKTVNNVFYSPSKKNIKYESLVNKPIKSDKSKELTGKAIYNFSQTTNDKGETVITLNVLANYPYYDPFQSSENITYVDIGTDSVVYVPYKE